MRIFGKEKITKMIKSSATSVQLPAGSKVHLGGSSYNLGFLSLDTSIVGLGGMGSSLTTNTFYYVYTVLNAGTVYLVASTSSIKPSYKYHRKVGAFQIDGNGDILHAFYRNEEFTKSRVDITSYANANIPIVQGGTLTGNFSSFQYSIEKNIMYINSFYEGVNAGSGALPVYYNLPFNLLLDNAESSGFIGECTTYRVQHVAPSDNEYLSCTGSIGSSQQINVINMGTGGLILGSNCLSGCQINHRVAIPILGFAKELDWNNY